MKIHHHKFTVTDMDRSLLFYRDLLGFELIYDAERSNLPSYDTIMGYTDVKLRVSMLRDSFGSVLALIQYHNPEVQIRRQANYFQGSSQICLQTDDIDADYERLTRAGVASRSQPVNIIRDGMAVARACYILDPDDIAIELYQPLL
ncbi:MAG TPA: VOC family protein [Tepidisphaeraceae bacterium]|nr:VOC family protein [Tepidisphaeraceae bacterium]